MKAFFQTLLLLIVWMACVVPKGIAADTAIWAPAPLTQLIEEGLANNQEIKSIESTVESLKEEISYAGSLNDPRIGIGVLNLPADTFRFDQEPMTQKQIFIAQKIPWFGKLKLRSQQAALKAFRQEAILKTKQLELARNIAKAYYELGFVASSQKIIERLAGKLEQLLRVSETRYAAGQGLQQDVLQAQVELSKLLEEEITLERQHRLLEDRINGFLNREGFLPVAPPENLPYPDINLNVEELQNLALKTNPWLAVRQAEIDQASADVELARKDYMPDMDFKVAYGQRDENQMGQDWADFVSASVVVNIPFWKKKRQDKKLAATRARHRAAVALYKNLLNSLPHQIDALSTDIQNTQKNYTLIKDALIIQAEQWARSSLAAYEVGKVEFNTMTMAQIRLLRFELQAEKYLFNLYEKRVELEEALGSPLSQDYAQHGLQLQKERKL